MRDFSDKLVPLLEDNIRVMIYAGACWRAHAAWGAQRGAVLCCVVLCGVGAGRVKWHGPYTSIASRCPSCSWPLTSTNLALSMTGACLPQRAPTGACCHAANTELARTCAPRCRSNSRATHTLPPVTPMCHTHQATRISSATTWATGAGWTASRGRVQRAGRRPPTSLGPSAASRRARSPATAHCRLCASSRR